MTTILLIWSQQNLLTGLRKTKGKRASQRVTNLTVLTIKISSGIAYEDERVNASLYGGQEGGLDKSAMAKCVPQVSVMTNNGKTQ